MRATLPRAKPITAREFEGFNPEWRYDLIKGELRPMPPMPGEEHGRITYDLGWELGAFVRQHQLGQCYASETRFLVERDPDTALAPDWAFIAQERLPKKPHPGFGQVVPDAVLEVRSSSDREKEVQEKMQRWMRVGVRIAWELNVKRRTLTVYHPGQPPRKVGLNGFLEGEDVLPGFRLALRSLFQAHSEP